MITAALEKTTRHIAELRGWRGKLACFAAGALTVLGFAPFHFWPVIFLTFPFLFLMLDKARHWRSAALYALAFGYGFYMAGTYWIAFSLAVDVEKFGWMIPLSVLGLSFWFALFFLPFGALVRATRTDSTVNNLLRFAVLWTLMEYVHTLGIFGFPWNLMASMGLASDRISQLGALVGPYGLGFFSVLAALLPVLWLRRDPWRQHATALILLLTIIAYSYGMWRMPPEAAMSDTRIRIVQPSIPQTLKWSEEGRRKTGPLYAGLTRLRTDAPTPRIIIWPETAVPFTLRDGSPLPAELAELLPPGGVLLTGAMRSEGGQGDYTLYNSLAVIDDKGQWRGSYDKHQLVPLGEFVPFRDILPLDKITPGNIDFSRGEGPRTLSYPDVPPFSPLVCYEIIFPWMAVGKERPEWIVNVTNDAWYGESPGPHQHFDAARMRAIEQGLPVVRAANTGISSVIDPYGRPVKQLPLDSVGIIDQSLPISLAPTLYVRAGEWVTLIILTMCWFVTVSRRFRVKK